MYIFLIEGFFLHFQRWGWGRGPYRPQRQSHTHQREDHTHFKDGHSTSNLRQNIMEAITQDTKEKMKNHYINKKQKFQTHLSKSDTTINFDVDNKTKKKKKIIAKHIKKEEMERQNIGEHP